MKSKSLKNKQFFWRFLGSYILLFMVPFLAMLMTYITAAVSIREEILSSNRNTLYQFFRSIDVMLNEISEKGMDLAYSPEVQEYAKRDESSVSRPSFSDYQLKNLLSSMKLDYYENIFIVFHKIDRIAGCDTVLSAENFYGTYYKDYLSYTEFSELLSPASSGRGPSLIAFGENSGKSILGISCSFSGTGQILSSPEYTVVITLNPDHLYYLLENAVSYNDNLFMILDASGVPVLSSSPLKREIQFPPDTVKELSYMHFNDRKYAVQTFPSQVLNSTYLSAIPVNEFWQRLNSLLSVFLGSTLLCLLLSGYVAYKLARINYSPIKDILKLIGSQTWKKYGQQKNEMDLIKNVLRDSLTEITVLSHWKEVQEDNLRNSFLLHTLMDSGSIDKAEPDCDDLFLRHHIRLKSDLFAVILITAKQCDAGILGDLSRKENDNILTFIYTNILGEIFSEKHQSFVVCLSPLCFACIVNFSAATGEQEDMEDMKKSIQTCGEFIRKHFGISGFYAISDVHSGLSGIHLCYEEAHKATAYYFLGETQPFVLYSDIKELPFHFDISNQEKCEYALLSYIKGEDDTETAAGTVDELLSLTGVHGFISLESFHCFQYYALILLRLLIHEIGGDSSISLNFSDEILYAETMEQVKSSLTEVLKKLRSFYRKSREASPTLCDQVQSHLQEQFRDPSLSLEQLGERFQISPYYLSRIFKEQKGVALPSYILSLRIEYAKKLLTTTSCSIEEVALQSGFVSSSTFVKAFKKNEGITPGAYRKLKIQPQKLK